VNGCTECIYELRTKRAVADLVSLQPINTKYSRDADARDLMNASCNWVDLFSSVQFICREQFLGSAMKDLTYSVTV